MGAIHQGAVGNGHHARPSRGGVAGHGGCGGLGR